MKAGKLRAFQSKRQIYATPDFFGLHHLKFWIAVKEVAPARWMRFLLGWEENFQDEWAHLLCKKEISFTTFDLFGNAIFQVDMIQQQKHVLKMISICVGWYVEGRLLFEEKTMEFVLLFASGILWKNGKLWEFSPNRRPSSSHKIRQFSFVDHCTNYLRNTESHD